MNGLWVRSLQSLALVQDGGRIGQRHLGVTQGGALDPWAMQWTNAILGNAPQSAVLELSLGGLELEAMIETRVVVGGTPAKLLLNGRAAQLWQPLHLRAGDRLSVSASGARRNYLAVQGGFTTAAVLGSRAMTLREGLGGLGDGLHARPLQRGDFLPCQPSTPVRQAEPAPPLDAFEDRSPFRVLPLDRGQYFSRPTRRALFAANYTLSMRADRMACRLDGRAIRPLGDVNASFAVAPGCIQVPPDGQPIVLLADCQTMGGYPVLGVVIGADMARLGRCVPGDSLNFEPVTPGAARRAWAKYVQTLPG